MKFLKLKNHLAVAVICCAAMLAAANAGATENGGGMYPNGAEGVMAGALPPPGLYYLNYLTHYSANRLNDKDGNKLPVDFHVNATANVFRLIYMTDKTFLGGNLGFYGIVPMVSLGGTLSPAPGVSLARTKSGIGDVSFSPLLVAWHGKNWHAASGLDITAPTGGFDKDEAFNIGRNYWTFQPIVAGTVLTDEGLEVSAKVMLDFNTENKATHYRSGQELHVDYAAAYHTGPWTFAGQGYAYKQITKDRADGAAANDGNKGQVLAVGPAVKYDFGRVSAEVKYQKEMLAENRSEGDKYWIKLISAF